MGNYETDIKVATLLDLKIFPHLESALRVQPELQVQKISSPQMVVSFAKKNHFCVVFFEVQNNDDLASLNQLFQETDKTSNKLKYIVVDSSKNPFTRKQLEKLDNEKVYVINPNLNFKAIRLQIEYIFQTFEQLSQEKLSSRTNIKLDIKDKELRKRARVISWFPALNISDDIWLIEREAEIKVKNDYYVVRLSGPGKDRGDFIKTSEENLWEFTFHDQILNDETRPGKWFFQGKRKPVFLQKEKKWYINGDRFQLFRLLDNLTQIRLQADDDGLRVAKNTHYAESIVIPFPDVKLVPGISLDDLNSIPKIENQKKDKTKKFDQQFLESFGKAPFSNFPVAPPFENFLYFSGLIKKKFKNSKQDDNPDLESRLLGLGDNASISVSFKQGNQYHAGQFDDFFDDKIQFYSEAGKIKNDQLLMIDMVVSYMNKKNKFYTEVIPSEITPLAGGVELITISLTPKMVKLFNKFIKVIESRQKSVNLFLSQARGI
jgi:hypothetical protein